MHVDALYNLGRQLEAAEWYTFQLTAQARSSSQAAYHVKGNAVNPLASAR